MNISRIIPWVIILFPFLVKAQNSTDSLLNVIKNSTSPIEKVDALIQLSGQNIRQNTQLQLSYATEAYRVADSIGYKEGIADALNQLGIGHLYSGKLDSSMSFYERSLQLYDSLDDQENVSQLLMNMGDLFQRRGNFPQASKYYFDALRIATEGGYKKPMSYILNNLGLLFEDRNDLDAALRYFKECMEISKEIDNKVMIAATSHNMANIYRKRDSLDRSLELFNQSLTYSEEMKNTFGIAINQMEIGGVYQQMNDPYLALQYVGSATNTFKDLGNKFQLSQCYLYLGKIYGDLDELENSEKYYLNTLTTAQETEATIIISEAHEKLANLFKDLGRPSKALEHFEKFMVVQSKLINQENEEEIIRIREEFESKKREDENELLRREKALQKELITRQNANTEYFIIILILAGVLLIASLIGYMALRRSNRRLVKLNQEIESQKVVIEERSELLEEAVHEVNVQNLELSDAIEKLETTQKQLIESEKMASLGVLSAGVGHEINNPLNFIKGGISGLSKHIKEDKKSDKSEALRYLDIVNEGVDRATSIVSSLAHFSRSNTDMNEKCDIHEILDHCQTILQNKLKGKVKVTKVYNAASTKVIGNVGRLHQAFLNILSNAEQAISETGNVVLKTSSIGNHIEISISDDGIGISKEDMSKIMDPFFTTKEPGVGTGLGLSITYKIIEDHEGTIKVKSEQGKGAVFSISLPQSS